jgi:hypothetical protein
MSEIIFEIITRSITLKAKQEGKALLSCTKKARLKTKKKERKQKRKESKQKIYISGF